MAFGALALALLLAQTLGLLHAIAHGAHGLPNTLPSAQAPGSNAGGHDKANASHTGHERHTTIAAWFDAHEDDSSECRLYDQLTHGDTLRSAIATFASTPPQPAHAHPATPAPRAADASWFFARAPPSRG
jgi:hypothetical protein